MDQFWTWFNVVTFGLRDVDPRSEISDPDEINKMESSAHENKIRLREALDNLKEMRRAAYEWVRKTLLEAAQGDDDQGWTRDATGTAHLDKGDFPDSLKYVGLYFHCYPHCSVNSLHLHIVDIYPGNTGPTFAACKFKNLHIDMVIDALEKEISDAVSESK